MTHLINIWFETDFQQLYCPFRDRGWVLAASLSYRDTVLLPPAYSKCAALYRIAGGTRYTIMQTIYWISSQLAALGYTNDSSTLTTLRLCLWQVRKKLKHSFFIAVVLIVYNYLFIFLLLKDFLPTAVTARKTEDGFTSSSLWLLLNLVFWEGLKETITGRSATRPASLVWCWTKRFEPQWSKWSDFWINQYWEFPLF